MPRPRTLVLRRADEFQRCYNQGTMAKNRLAVIHVFNRNDRERPRVGFSVSRRVGKAVERNRVRRWMREALLPLGDKLPEGYDIVFSARSPAKERGYWPLREAMVDLLRKTGMLRKEDETL